MNRFLVALSLLVLFSACPDDNPGMDAGAQCQLDTDCPAGVNTCVTPSCSAGVCGFKSVAAGFVLADQTAGDCQRRECDGQGNRVAVADPADVNDDDNDCTVDSCDGTTPVHEAAPGGTACGADNALACDGNGNCTGCTAPTDCDGANTECASPTCSQGMCGFSFAPQGTPLTAQLAGDCQQAVCDGQGQVSHVADSADLPDDANPCTDDVCTGTTPSNPPSNAGVACADAGTVCDGSGACVGCNAPADCPGQDSFCATRTCVDHACGVSFTADGTALTTQAAGDCVSVVCDGAGSTRNATDDTDVPNDQNPCTTDACTNGSPSNVNVSQGASCGLDLVCDDSGHCQGCNTPADCGVATACSAPTCTNGVCGVTFIMSGTPAGTQTPGDCHQRQCDGAGNIVNNVDDSDLPLDALTCTQDVCTAGTPSHPPVVAGTACADTGGVMCNGAGACVQCNAPADCGSATECTAFLCTAGTCSTQFAAFGTRVAAQSAGDCHANVCDGAGAVTVAVDDADVPVDGAQCTSDVCTNGLPSNPPVAVHTPCTQNGGAYCSSTGTCVACVGPTDCPGADTECQQRTCSANTCGVSNAALGTITTTQTPGDCRQNQCDGNGNTVAQNDDADVPADDGNQCTGESCSSGSPSHPNSPAGTTCSQSGGVVCSGAGACVQCVGNSDCPGGTCVSNVCQAASCTNNVQDGAETDVDCGGGTCAPCGLNKHCALDADCESALCSSGTCAQFVVTSVVPSANTLNVGVNATFAVTFSLPASASLSGQTTGGACTGALQVSADDFTTCVGLTAVAFSNGNTTASFGAALAKSTPYKLRVTTAASDASSHPLATAYVQSFITEAASTSCGVVISQVFGGGGNNGAPFKNDFIEVHNLGSTMVDVTGWSVQYASSTGTSWQTTALTGVINPGAFLLVQEAAGAADAGALPTPDFTGGLAMSGSTGKVALVSATAARSGACPDAGVVDLVGFGGANCYLGSAPVPTLSNTTAARRGGFACNNTPDNKTDFVVASPSPNNSASAAVVCSACGVANETDAANEVDYCNVQAPTSISGVSGTPVTAYGQLYEAGTTEAPGAASNVVVQFGFGPQGVDPRVQSGWQFFPATFNTQYGNNDEYQATINLPSQQGTYWYAFRFSVDNGNAWTFGDLDGAGANAGLGFDTAQLPVMTVTP